MLEKGNGGSPAAFAPMTELRLRRILSRITRTRVLVVGDYCLDVYWFVDATRSEMSLETGLMTNPVREQQYSLGGAGNVVNNLVALSCREVLALGVIGEDPWGREMVRLFRQIGVNTEHVLVQKERWATLAYSKPYIRKKECSRFDFGNFNRLSSRTAAEVLERCRALIPEADAVVVNQQVRQGIHTPEFRAGLAGLIREFPEKIFIVDSRQTGKTYTGAFMKINAREAVRLCGLLRLPEVPNPRGEAFSVARELSARYGKPVFVTRGSRGIVVADDGGLCEIPAIRTIGRVDTVGAGDSALAGISVALAAGCDPIDAARLGNLVAGVTIRKINQTGTASPEEILTIHRQQAL